MQHQFVTVFDLHFEVDIPNRKDGTHGVRQLAVVGGTCNPTDVLA
jgi:hypothetical protein